MDTIFLLRKGIIYFGYLVLLTNVILYNTSNKEKSNAYKFISLYLIFSFIIQIISSYLASIKANNLFYFHIFNIGQFILMCLFFKTILKNKIFKIILKYIIFIVPISLVVFYIFNQKLLLSFNIVEIFICSIPLLVLSFMLFIEKMDSKNKKYIYFNSGFFLYLICSTLLFSAGNLEKDTRDVIWWTNSILYLVYQLLIFVEWYKNLREPIKRQ